MTGRLQDKVAVIVGAGCVGPGWGNGRAEAVLFAAEGATVIGVDRDLDAMKETVELAAPHRDRFHPRRCDVGDEHAVEQLMRRVVEDFGRIDVLVNNVGGSAAGGVAELSVEQWRAQLDYNLTTTFLTCRAALPSMLAAGSGAIVNTASVAGLRWSGAAQAGYAASKAGVIQLTRTIAMQYGPRGVRANTVVPGQLHTPLVSVRLADQRAGGDLDGLLASRLARIPLGFMGDGRDTANAALFLASDEARFVTGTELVVDGGMTARSD